MQLKNSVLVDTRNKPLKQDPNDPRPDPPLMTVAEVLLSCCLVPAGPGAPPRPAKEVTQRYEAALMLAKLEIGAEFELDLDMVAMLREDMLRVYPVLTAGQMLYKLEGKN
jgi:hypothetical protein